jgi:hypothetical protein
MSSPVASFKTLRQSFVAPFSGCYKAPALPPFKNFCDFEKESRRRPTDLAG